MKIYVLSSIQAYDSPSSLEDPKLFTNRQEAVWAFYEYGKALTKETKDWAELNKKREEYLANHQVRTSWTRKDVDKESWVTIELIEVEL